MFRLDIYCKTQEALKLMFDTGHFCFFPTFSLSSPHTDRSHLVCLFLRVRAASLAPLHQKSLLQPVKAWTNCFSPDSLTTLHQTSCLLWEEAAEAAKNIEGYVGKQKIQERNITLKRLLKGCLWYRLQTNHIIASTGPDLWRNQLCLLDLPDLLKEEWRSRSSFMRDIEGYCWGAVGTGCNSPDFSLFLYHKASFHGCSSEGCRKMCRCVQSSSPLSLNEERIENFRMLAGASILKIFIFNTCFVSIKEVLLAEDTFLFTILKFIFSICTCLDLSLH